ncbi:hypothetical protein Hanom_Chr04g00366161 [Helianthus anomalus]
MKLNNSQSILESNKILLFLNLSSFVSRALVESYSQSYSQPYHQTLHIASSTRSSLSPQMHPPRPHTSRTEQEPCVKPQNLFRHSIIKNHTFVKVLVYKPQQSHYQET